MRTEASALPRASPVCDAEEEGLARPLLPGASMSEPGMLLWYAAEPCPPRNVDSGGSPDKSWLGTMPGYAYTT